MPCWAKPDLAALKHRERAEAAPILELALPRLCVERAMHPSPQRRVTRGEHEAVLEAMQSHLAHHMLVSPVASVCSILRPRWLCATAPGESCRWPPWD